MNTWNPKLPPFGVYKQQEFEKVARTGLFIYQIGDTPRLRKKSKKIAIKQIPSHAMQTKIAYVKRCLLRYREITGFGRGIAAIQVGIPEQFAVIYTPEKLITIINPAISAESNKKLIYSEMCMSAAPLIAPVVRPAWIEFFYYDEFGNKNYWKTKDDTDKGRMMNRVFEHEIDHLSGIINIDHCSSRSLIFLTDPSYYDKAKFTEITA